MPSITCTTRAAYDGRVVAVPAWLCCSFCSVLWMPAAQHIGDLTFGGRMHLFDAASNSRAPIWLELSAKCFWSQHRAIPCPTAQPFLLFLRTPSTQHTTSWCNSSGAIVLVDTISSTSATLVSGEAQKLMSGRQGRRSLFPRDSVVDLFNRTERTKTRTKVQILVGAGFLVEPNYTQS